MTKPSPTTGELEGLLLWCREQGFRVREIAHGSVRLVLDDLRIDATAEAEQAPALDIHRQWARELGVQEPDDEDEEEGAA